MSLAHTASAETPAWLLTGEVVQRADLMAVIETHAIEPADASTLRTASRLRLPLPGETLEVHLVERVERGADSLTWFGRRTGEHDIAVLLTHTSGALSGLVYGDDAVYEIASLDDGTPVLMRIEQDLFPPCSGGIGPAIRASSEDPLPTFGVRDNSPDIEVDVLVLYTPQSRAGAGGDAQIRSLAQAAVDASNAAFANSDMVTRFRAVAIELWDRDESTMGANASARLGTLRSDAWVRNLRDSVGADLVGLIVEDGQGGCGIGFVMRTPSASFASSAYQITARSCAVGNLTYAHEHGHNMGFEHNPENGASPANASYDWSFGHHHGSPPDAIDRFRTVMSYSNPCANSCTRRPFFSNPDVDYRNTPTGIDGSRDNARSGDLVYDIVRNFRARVKFDLLFADGFE